jgi:hypothetical protein
VTLKLMPTICARISSSEVISGIDRHQFGRFAGQPDLNASRSISFRTAGWRLRRWRVGQRSRLVFRLPVVKQSGRIQRRHLGTVFRRSAPPTSSGGVLSASIRPASPLNRI